jgi:hypothetical protein
MGRGSVGSLVCFALAVGAPACTEDPDPTNPTEASSSAASVTSAGGSGGAIAGTGGAGGDNTAMASSSSGVLSDCAVDGIAGQCIDVVLCDAMDDWVSTPGFCPGPAAIQCCTESPTTVENPPVPSGYKFMMQSEVTPDMTSWAVAILHAPIDYPMYSTTTKTFGALDVLARVEWHPPDFLNDHVHRGVTLYEPL